MEPLAVTDLAARGSHRIGAVFLEPLVGVEKVVLLTSKHPSQRLPHHIGGVHADAGWRECPIEAVGLAAALVDDLIKPAPKWIRLCDGAEPKPDHGGLSGADHEPVMCGRFGPYLMRADGLLAVRHHVIVDPILDIGRGAGCAEDPLVVRFVLCEQKTRTPFAIKEVIAQLIMRGAIALAPFSANTCRNDGLASFGHHVQVLRNQRVGSRWSKAASGPRLRTLIWIRMSWGSAFAYSTNTSKYRFSLNTPV